MPEWLLYQALRFLTGKRETHSFLMSVTPTGREALLSSGGKMQWVKPLIEVSRACEKWPPGLLSFWRTNSMERKPATLTSQGSWLLAGRGPAHCRLWSHPLHSVPWWDTMMGSWSFFMWAWVISKHGRTSPLVGFPTVCFCRVLVPAEICTRWVPCKCSLTNSPDLWWSAKGHCLILHCVLPAPLIFN